MNASKQRQLWRKYTEIIRQFVDVQPLYEQLCSEVAYALRKDLKSADIEISAVTYRTKTLVSFLDKIDRKKYSDPLEQISDLAGVRVVHLYAADLSEIETLISNKFQIIEKVDKLADYGDDRFGYGATHFIVKIGEASKGARYDDLRPLVCEIQVRTVLQDAWSVVSHHLAYKRESDIPTELRRKINSLAGLFETADDQFERLRGDRELYLKSIQEKSEDESSFADEEINVDTVKVFLTSTMSGLPLAIGDADFHIPYVLEDLNRKKYKSIGDFARLFERTRAAREAYYKDEEITSATGTLAVAIALDDPAYRVVGWDEDDLARFEAFEDLVEAA